MLPTHRFDVNASLDVQRRVYRRDEGVVTFTLLNYWSIRLDLETPATYRLSFIVPLTYSATDLRHWLFRYFNMTPVA